MWSSLKLLLDFIPVLQSFVGIKSDTVNIQGINRLAAAERDVGIYFTEVQFKTSNIMAVQHIVT